MKKIFEIEYPNKFGKDYITPEKLESCLISEGYVLTKIKIKDITKKELSIEKLLENL